MKISDIVPNFTLVSSNETENSRQLTCMEMEKIEVRAGGSFRLEAACNFTVNRGLLPLTVPLKLTTVSDHQSHVVPQMDDDLEEHGHIEIQGARRAVLLPLGSSPDHMEVDLGEPMDSY